MKPFLILIFVCILFLSCRHHDEKDNFSGKWQMISLIKNGKQDSMPNNTINGVLKITDQKVGIYLFQIFDVRFLLKQTDNYYLVGTNYTVFIRYLPQSDHIIFDIENDASIMEFKRLSPVIKSR